MLSQRPPEFIPLLRAAKQAGIPAGWLKDEANAGRIPHLKIRDRLLFNFELLKQTLLERAEREAQAAPALEACHE